MKKKKKRRNTVAGIISLPQPQPVRVPDASQKNVRHEEWRRRDARRSQLPTGAASLDPATMSPFIIQTILHIPYAYYHNYLRNLFRYFHFVPIFLSFFFSRRARAFPLWKEPRRAARLIIMIMITTLLMTSYRDRRCYTYSYTRIIIHGYTYTTSILVRVLVISLAFVRIP